MKHDGTKKARYACNSSSHKKGTVTLGNAHAKSLEQSGARLFWALTSLTAYQVHGSDATNAFAEDPPPIVPLCVAIDEQHRNWNNIHKKFKETQKVHVLPVHQALQGHPESPRL